MFCNVDIRIQRSWVTWAQWNHTIISWPFLVLQQSNKQDRGQLPTERSLFLLLWHVGKCMCRQTQESNSGLLFPSSTSSLINRCQIHNLLPNNQGWAPSALRWPMAYYISKYTLIFEIIYSIYKFWLGGRGHACHVQDPVFNTQQKRKF